MLIFLFVKSFSIPFSFGNPEYIMDVPVEMQLGQQIGDVSPSILSPHPGTPEGKWGIFSKKTEKLTKRAANSKTVISDRRSHTVAYTHWAWVTNRKSVLLRGWLCLPKVKPEFSNNDQYNSSWWLFSVFCWTSGWACESAAAKKPHYLVPKSGSNGVANFENDQATEVVPLSSNLLSSAAACYFCDVNIGLVVY